MSFPPVFVEVVLQLLVGVVDTELLKGVLLKHLEPKDVENTDGVTLYKQVYASAVICTLS